MLIFQPMTFMHLHVLKRNTYLLNIHIQLLDQVIKFVSRPSSQNIAKTRDGEVWAGVTTAYVRHARSQTQALIKSKGLIFFNEGQKKSKQWKQNWHKEYKMQLFLKAGGIQERSKNWYKKPVCSATEPERNPEWQVTRVGPGELIIVTVTSPQGRKGESKQI